MLRFRGTFTLGAACLAAWIVASPAAAQSSGPLTWPQKFTVHGPEVKSFAFPVTRPGPVIIDVQALGVLVVMTVQGPPQPVQQQGTGTLHLAYNATPQDVQRAPFWIVRIRLGQPSAQPVSGILNVQQPAFDAAQVQRAASAVAAQAPAARAQVQAAANQNAAQAAAQTNALLQQQRAQLEQQRAQRHATLMAQSQPLIDQLRTAAPGGIVSRALDNDTPGNSPQVATRAVPGVTMTRISPPTAAPVIKSLSVTQGEPNDPVLITGTGFGSTPAEVHFVIGPNVDVVANQNGLIWTDTSIFVYVPTVSGVTAFNGTLYVKRNGTLSNLMPFAFIPLMDRRVISIPNPPADSILPRYDDYQVIPTWSAATGVARTNCNMFWNPSGEDLYFRTTLLKNGWKVYAPPSLQTQYALYAGGGAFVLFSAIGGNSPFVDVYWWVDVAFPVCATYGYSLVMYIEGPNGTSDGVVVP